MTIDHERTEIENEAPPTRLVADRLKEEDAFDFVYMHLTDKFSSVHAHGVLENAVLIEDDGEREYQWMRCYDGEIGDVIEQVIIIALREWEAIQTDDFLTEVELRYRDQVHAKFISDLIVKALQGPRQ